jgi:hypothetical protein
MAAPEKQTLHFPPAFHGLEHGDFVGVFDVAAYRNAHGYAGNAESLPLELLGEVGGGGFALDGGIGGEDDFLDFAAGDAADQIGDAQLFGADAVQWRNRAVEHVVDTVKMSRLVHWAIESFTRASLHWSIRTDNDDAQLLLTIVEISPFHSLTGQTEGILC